MKILKMLFLAVLLMAFSQAAWAQCPSSIGQWSTQDGTMLGGRATEAWCNGNQGEVGNTQSAMSWDGVSLGTQWSASGMAIDPAGASLVADTVDGFGNGIQIYITDYVGGQFWLSKDHSWADGVADLTGDLTTFNVTTTITIQGGLVVGSSSNVAFTGTFSNCPGLNGCEISFGITNALLAWHPDFGGTMDTGYPDLECGATIGEAYDVCCIVVEIYCAVGAEETTWGSLKALYK